jgi:hypothetical protein
VAMERARAAVERLRLGVEGESGANGALTVSVGVAEIDPRNASDALARADAALYSGKVLGRNRIVLDPVSSEAASSRGRRDGTQRSLAQVVDRVRQEHAVLRVLMDRVLAASCQPPAFPHPLGGAIWDLYITFDSHLAMEEADLVPLIVASAGGIMHAERWLEEHRQQRTMLLALVSESEEETKPLDQLADDARWLSAVLTKDMEAEEQELDRRLRAASVVRASQ